MTAAISLKGVVKRFGKFAAVDHLDLEIPHGTTFGLLGPNGAGKTTSIRMIMNITKPDEGEIRVLGEKMNDKLQERIGYLPEERGLYRKMKVVDQLLFFAAIKSVDKDTAMKRLSPWIDSMDLRPWLQKKTEELSKGMQQKVQFLGTLVHDPEVLILDEPTNSLDPGAVREFRTLLRKLARDGRSLLLVTHHIADIIPEIERVILIKDGRIVADGPKARMLTSARLSRLFGARLRVMRKGRSYDVVA